MRQAAGAIVLAENTGRTLLMRRADVATLEDWGLNDVGAIALVYTVIVITVRQEFVPTIDHPGCAMALEELGRSA